MAARQSGEKAPAVAAAQAEDQGHMTPPGDTATTDHPVTLSLSRFDIMHPVLYILMALSIGHIALLIAVSNQVSALKERLHAYEYRLKLMEEKRQ